MKNSRLTEPQSLSVAYHDGPPAIHFFGRPWRRGVADEVTAAQWAGMQARGDFKEFDFKPEPASAPAAQAGGDYTRSRLNEED